MSADEKTLRSVIKTEDNLLLFSWICPRELEKLCNEKDFTSPNNKNNIISFKFSEYKIFLDSQKDFENYNFILILNKDRRSTNKTLTITIKKPILNIQNENQNVSSSTSNVDTKQKNIFPTKNEIDITDLIHIEPVSLSGSDLIIESSFLDNSIIPSKYMYLWTITHFTKDFQYLNGRKEINLRIKKSDLLIGFNEINLILTNPITKRNFLKKYNYENG